MRDRTVVIDGGRIAHIEPAATTGIPADADVMNAAGRSSSSRVTLPVGPPEVSLASTQGWVLGCATMAMVTMR